MSQNSRNGTGPRPKLAHLLACAAAAALLSLTPPASAAGAGTSPAKGSGPAAKDAAKTAAPAPSKPADKSPAAPAAPVVEADDAATAPDFPPGSFSDGGQYHLSDFKGKAVVLFFYEQSCPTCRGTIPERNKVVEAYKDKPIKFIAVGPNDSVSDVLSYVRGTHLEMPAFADTLGVMEKRYGFHISLQNIYQFRVIGPDGGVVGQDMTPAELDGVLKSVKWKYKDAGYDPKLNGVIDLLEWNQYEAALRQLRPLTKTKATADSANKLFEAVKVEGKQWLDDAEKAKSTNPAKAFDLYTKLSACFPGDELGKQSDEALKTLRKEKAVTDELAARRQYDALYPAMARATSRQRQDVAGYCTNISTQYPDTPTGKKAARLAQDLAGRATP